VAKSLLRQLFWLEQRRWPREESNLRTQIRSLPLYPLSYGAGFGQSSGVETEAAARRWVEGWSQAWPAADADAVAALYAEDAQFRSQPFRELQEPRAYAEWAFSEQDEAECWFGEPFVAGDRALVEYWAVVRYQGRDETIAGIAVIRFGPDGLVAEQHDYWNAHEGRREPPAGWGR
jgi:ketosteroid isomerase-like protein